MGKNPFYKTPLSLRKNVIGVVVEDKEAYSWYAKYREIVARMRIGKMVDGAYRPITDRKATFLVVT